MFQKITDKLDGLEETNKRQDQKLTDFIEESRKVWDEQAKVSRAVFRRLDTHELKLAEHDSCIQGMNARFQLNEEYQEKFLKLQKEYNQQTQDTLQMIIKGIVIASVMILIGLALERVV